MPQKKLVHPNHHREALKHIDRISSDLLDLEENSTNYSASSIQSKLLFCQKDDILQPTFTKSESIGVPAKKPNICSIPESSVLGKVKDFLGVMSEANKRLKFDSMDDSEKYDIEVLNGYESEYIEMDLMLGVADLHTPEAVAAAESAMAGYQPTISLATGNRDDDDNDGDSEDDDDSDGIRDEEKVSKVSSGNGNSSSEAMRNQPSKDRPKIVELS